MPGCTLIRPNITREWGIVEEILSPTKQKERGRRGPLHDGRPRGTRDLEDHLTPVQFRQVARRFFPRVGTMYIELKDEAQAESVCAALQNFGDINRVSQEDFNSNRLAAEKYKKDRQETSGWQSNTSIRTTHLTV